MNTPDYLSSLLSRYAPLSPLDATGLSIHQAPDLFSLWEAQEEAQKRVCPPPFWAIVWPANKLLAQYILQNRNLFSGRSVLDIGCGCGAASVAAALTGASVVIANDIDPVALSVTELNAAANGVTVTTSDIDITGSPSDTMYDTILIADMFYEASATSPFYRYLQQQLSGGSNILIADASRPFTPREKLQPLTEATFNVDPAVEGVTSRTVTLYHMIADQP